MTLKTLKRVIVLFHHFDSKSLTYKTSQAYDKCFVSKIKKK